MTMTAEQTNSAAYAAALSASTFYHCTAQTAQAMVMPTARNKRAPRSVYGIYASLKAALAAKAAAKIIVRASRTDTIVTFKGAVVEVKPDGTAEIVG